ncbi:unnamed protein product [Cuscuta campestris]|uniref:Uncharacterized protein n=1 Tax=Cuscuta campestris TaxID=132261 RepID=A0A484MJM8_9ASTE|nr:unnamed protein product [Cuscuta campestris]
MFPTKYRCLKLDWQLFDTSPQKAQHPICAAYLLLVVLIGPVEEPFTLIHARLHERNIKGVLNDAMFREKK